MIQDYAEDVRAVVRWLLQRKDVDPKRIAVVGHSEGAWVALLAAEREKRISAVVSIAGPASTGSELVLEQQQRALDQLKLTPEEREKKVALQKQIQSAVVSGKGWELIPQKSAERPTRRGSRVSSRSIRARYSRTSSSRSSSCTARWTSRCHRRTLTALPKWQPKAMPRPSTWLSCAA
jgi:pimeloyl-ACP methyl ester carboxylesterase